MSILLLSFYILRSHLTAAASLQSNLFLKNDIALVWVPAASGRGTKDILSYCLATLGLCVWKALHLNIPAMDESRWEKYWRQLKWVLIALLAPEVVVFTGIEQYVAAKSFLKKIRRLHKKMVSTQDEEPSEHFRNYKFDMQYAMYAVMGGFTVDIEQLHNKLKFATLTTNGILLLADQGKFVSPYPTSISTKSRTDGLTKALVCCQVFSFLGQVAERWHAGLTVSLLEWNISVHIIYTLVMYIFWWQKPYSVQDPTLVAMDGRSNILAFIVASSRWPQNSGFVAKHIRTVDKIRSKLLGSVDPPFTWFDNLEGAAASNKAIDNTASNISKLGRRRPTRPFDGISDTNGEVLSHPSIITYDPVSNIEPMRHLQGGDELVSGFGPIDDPDDSNGMRRIYKIGLSQKDLHRFDLAGTYMRKQLASSKRRPVTRRFFVGGSLAPKVGLSEPFYDRPIQPFGGRLICYRAGNWPTLEQLRESVGIGMIPLFGGLAIAAILYGFIHLLVRPTLLPTKLEVKLWSISCFLLALSMLIIVIIPVIVGYHFKMKSNLYSVFEWVEFSQTEKTFYEVWSKRSVFWRISFLVGAGLFGLVYISTRAFIIVESVISLRHIPVDVYQTPNSTFWGFLPHVK